MSTTLKTRARSTAPSCDATVHEIDQGLIHVGRVLHHTPDEMLDLIVAYADELESMGPWSTEWNLPTMMTRSRTTARAGDARNGGARPDIRTWPVRPRAVDPRACRRNTTE